MVLKIVSPNRLNNLVVSPDIFYNLAAVVKSDANICTRHFSFWKYSYSIRVLSEPIHSKNYSSDFWSLSNRRLQRAVISPQIYQASKLLSVQKEETSCAKFSTSSIMAKSKFDYVKQFEVDDPCLPNCWIVIRIDGKAFHKFTDAHNYMKPNDERGLGLMTCAAQKIMNEFNEIVLAYGQSDEYSFVFHKNCKVFNRRASKIMTNLVSLFASSFTMYWPRYFNTQELHYPPAFDARVVLYPSDENLRDYLSWRQADCHINNLYNTCFWKLVQEKGLSPAQSEARLRGTLSSDKNELLFSEFNMNYNNIPELFRKGSVLIRKKEPDVLNQNVTSINEDKAMYSKSDRKKAILPCIVSHCDIIGKSFWDEHSYILGSK
ncbi:tRNA-histidine guanylyltransferase 1-like [Bulinus truncatus]|nr:tRNA-histidine guanylyltransferase 1-like [Bulinus truncatus]